MQFSKLCYTHTNKAACYSKFCLHTVKSNAIFQIVLHAHKQAIRKFQVLRLAHTSNVHEYDYTNSGCAGSTSTLSCAMSTHRPAARALHQSRRASRCLGTSRSSSCGSSSTTSPTPRVRVPRHVARLVAPLVVDYFAYATRPGASAHRAARRAARRRLLRLRRASRCLGTFRGSSRRSSSTTSPTPRVPVPRHVARLVAPFIVDYFAYAARPGASARRAARRAARRRLLRLRHASGCLGTSRGSSHGLLRRSSSTTSPTPRVRLPRLVARLFAPLVVDYFAYAARPGASARRTARRVARR
jgi:hypothetical protein